MSRYTAGLVFLYHIHAVIFRPKLIICLIKIRPTTDRIHKTSIQITICVIKWPTLTMLWHVRNIFSAVHKPKCVHEYIIKIALTKTTMTLLRVISKRTQYPLNMTTTPGKCNNIIIMYKLRKFSFQTIKYL